jgi:hypothetical protein
VYQPTPRRQRFIDRLPEQVWSPFLGRATRWSPQQVAIATAATRHPGLTQREVASRVGCSQGSVSKTLALMKRLGVLAVSTTRGRFGSTVAWLRRGVRRMIPPLQNGYISRIDRVGGGGIIQRGGPPRRLADILRGSA